MRFNGVRSVKYCLVGHFELCHNSLCAVVIFSERIVHYLLGHFALCSVIIQFVRRSVSVAVKRISISMHCAEHCSLGSLQCRFWLYAQLSPVGAFWWYFPYCLMRRIVWWTLCGLQWNAWHGTLSALQCHNPPSAAEMLQRFQESEQCWLFYFGNNWF